MTDYHTEWNKTERWVYNQLVAGEIADLNERFGYSPDPTKKERWGDERNLSSSFLEAILLDEMYSAHIHRNGVVILGARFINDVDLKNGKTTSLFGLSYSRFEGSIYLDDFISESSISLDGSAVSGVVKAQRFSVKKSLFLRYDASFANINLSSAHIGGQFSLAGTNVSELLNMDGLHVGGSLFMNSNEKSVSNFNEVVLSNAHISDQLVLVGANISGSINMDSLQVDGPLLMRASKKQIPFEVGGDVDLVNAKLGNNLDLSGISATREKLIVSLVGTVIAGELRLWQKGAQKSEWKGATLILKNVSCGSLQDHEDAWPEKLDLTGFEYKTLGGLNSGDEGSIAYRTVKWMKEWLEKSIHYSPQPYKQLATALSKDGHESDAKVILYELKEKQREMEGRQRIKIWMWLEKTIIGYGYKNWRAFRWVGLFFATGILVLYFSGEGARLNMPNGFAYSLDMLLPIIQLRPVHYTKDFDLVVWWVRWYFYFHQIVGYGLAFFLIAGLSGLTKNDK